MDTENTIQELKADYPAGPSKIKDVSNMSLIELYDYIATLTNVPDFVKSHFDKKKEEELEKMKDFSVRFNPILLRDYIKKNIYSVEELKSHGLVSDEVLPIINNYEHISRRLPDMNDVKVHCKTELTPNSTDVYFFGIPATGKTCVLGGLLSAGEKLRYESLTSGGPYADALVQYFQNGITPPLTNKDQLTAINAQVEDSRGRLTNVNIIDLPGETFAIDIVKNTENVLSFEQMGNGATNLLQGKNPKEFFIFIDPTRDLIDFEYQIEKEREDGSVYYEIANVQILQTLTIKKFIELFKRPENRKIMNKVRSISIVLTKVDKLRFGEEERDLRCRELLSDKKYLIELDKLARYCRQKGMNKESNGNLRIFPCSLGNFYICDTFVYNKKDCLNLASAIEQNARHPFFNF